MFLYFHYRKKMQESLQSLPSSIIKTIRLEEDLGNILNSIDDDTKVGEVPKTINALEQNYCIYNKPTTKAHKCQKCERFVHAICVQAIEEGFGGSILCNLCLEKKKIPQIKKKLMRD